MNDRESIVKVTIKDDPPRMNLWDTLDKLICLIGDVVVMAGIGLILAIGLGLMLGPFGVLAAVGITMLLCLGRIVKG